MTTETNVKTGMPNLTRQKLSAIIRKSGVPASKAWKGRVTWRVSNGYDLMLWVDTRSGGYLRMPERGQKIARVRVWADSREKEIVDLQKIADVLNGEGVPTILDADKTELMLCAP